ncbi:MAG: Nucleopolyhedrovirus P10 protein [Phormidesmis priestleyi Ana]|uniref:Nucleopolyhedrovirus P10 protein n=1 Tax=Phormidesmis priestleyi Ana TaxID=1666911 RepID=A0A0P7Z3H3_9CYAN|nr:MAG: Nucleopolyhedrovirus P10 protein [Phormidesmis priestleyi Ana]
MSTSVLPQLLEVDSELSAQASALQAQLNELQEKRKGIQTVIDMFESKGGSELAEIAAVTVPVVATKPAVKTAPKKATPAKSAKEVKAPKAATKAKTVKAPKEGTVAKVKASRGRPAKVKTKATKAAVTSPKKTAESKRSGGRTANWQRYVQDSYSKAPLPDVIVGVLQAQPNHIFKIADVMSVVFKEDMPENQFLKARNRVSNILSAGAREGDWYRGRGGTYSVSEKAIKAAG